MCSNAGLSDDPPPKSPPEPRYDALPVRTLSAHCVLPERNDVGAILRYDVVVILSIWGKGLGGTGHLGL